VHAIFSDMHLQVLAEVGRVPHPSSLIAHDRKPGKSPYASPDSLKDASHTIKAISDRNQLYVRILGAYQACHTPHIEVHCREIRIGCIIGTLSFLLTAFTYKLTNAVMTR
jgi:hypothetical protein